MLRKLTMMLLVAVLVIIPYRESSVAEAQGPSVIDTVLRQFSNYMGINPPLTSAELEFGSEERPFDASYRFDGLDLTVDPLSCDSRIMEEDEEVIGNFGYRVLITMNSRVYEFRVNAAGTQLIRCFFGEPIDFDGTSRGIGTTISGDQASNVALRHLSGYLDISPTMTIELAENPNEDTPRIFYNWLGLVYEDASLACPALGVDYDVRDTFAYRVTLTVNGIVYPYRVRGDGNVVLLCRTGRPDDSSIGVPSAVTE